jgi:DNA-binding PadR family transcriptional regulator
MCVAHIVQEFEVGTDRDRTLAQSSTLRPVEFHILLSVAGGERHGYGIMQDAKARGEAVPDIGTLYRALARMLDQGWVAVVEAGESEGDERRKHYRITDLGLRVAKAEARRLDSLTRAARLGGLLKKEAR